MSIFSFSFLQTAIYLLTSWRRKILSPIFNRVNVLKTKLQACIFIRLISFLELWTGFIAFLLAGYPKLLAEFGKQRKASNVLALSNLCLICTQSSQHVCCAFSKLLLILLCNIGAAAPGTRVSCPHIIGHMFLWSAHTSAPGCSRPWAWGSWRRKWRPCMNDVISKEKKKKKNARSCCTGFFLPGRHTSLPSHPVVFITRTNTRWWCLKAGKICNLILNPRSDLLWAAVQASCFVSARFSDSARLRSESSLFDSSKSC